MRQVDRILMAGLGAVLIGLSGCEQAKPWTPLVSVGDGFVQAIQAKDLGAARSHLDVALQTRLAPGQLEGFIGTTGVAQADSVAWINGSVAGERGTLYGEYHSPGSDGSTPLRLDLRQEQGSWRIQGIQRGIRVLEPEVRDYFVPYDPEARKLVTDTTLRFADAVAKGDLAGFWATCSEPFRRKHDQQAFERGFAGFVEQKVNLLPAAKLSPQFDRAPALAPDGTLRLAGHFPTRPSRIDFDYEYLPDKGGWTLGGIKLAVTPVQARPEAP